MAPVLLCPECGTKHPLDSVGARSAFPCNGCGRTLKVPEQAATVAAAGTAAVAVARPTRRSRPRRRSRVRRAPISVRTTPTRAPITHRRSRRRPRLRPRPRSRGRRLGTPTRRPHSRRCPTRSRAGGCASRCGSSRCRSRSSSCSGWRGRSACSPPTTSPTSRWPKAGIASCRSRGCCRSSRS